ncbi:MAG: CPBP family intramembrane metalloprotease [Phycisphaerales bacterium]|nr:CPBP family intramembrane metalloprotease [Phycisphaerales bacterium]
MAPETPAPAALAPPIGTDKAAADPPASRRRAATAGPVFLAFILAAVLGVLGSVAIVLTYMAIARGVSSWSTTQRGFDSGPTIILLSALPMELALAGMAFLMVRRSKRGPVAELGLDRHRLAMKEWPILIIGSGVPFALGAALASIAPSTVDPDTYVELWRNISPASAVLWVVVIGAMPGLAEEIFFRGFMQRRLARAWSPVAAIIVSSLMFAFLHLDPATMALALVLGLWLGFVAWRTGSTWPGIAIHATINSSWNAGQIWFRQTEPDPSPVYMALGALGVISLLCFAWSVRFLLRRPAGASPSAEPVARSGAPVTGLGVSSV